MANLFVYGSSSGLTLIFYISFQIFNKYAALKHYSFSVKNLLNFHQNAKFEDRY